MFLSAEKSTSHFTHYALTREIIVIISLTVADPNSIVRTGRGEGGIEHVRQEKGKGRPSPKPDTLMTFFCRGYTLQTVT